MMYAVADSPFLDLIDNLIEFVQGLADSIMSIFKTIPSFIFPVVLVYIVVSIVYLVLDRG